MGDPDVISDAKRYRETVREHTALRKLEAAAKRYFKILDDIEGNESLLEDPDFAEEAKSEIERLKGEIPDAERAVLAGLLPPDPLEGRSAVFEVRAGTGGDEASLFAGDLFEMYSRYANKMRWTVEITSESEGTAGGYKEVVAMISGTDVYAHLKFEAGTHRVQRVPATESQGRIHTSACTVAILPEAQDVDIKIDESDLRIDVYRASGARGQHDNKTESAIRITHIPTNTVVTCQDERSQHKNKARALKILQSRLYDMQRQKLDSERATARKSMVGSGDRSERIRTYNYPQNRITDHRIGLTVYNLDAVVETGELDEIINALKTAEHLELLNSEEA